MVRVVLVALMLLALSSLAGEADDSSRELEKLREQIRAARSELDDLSGREADASAALARSEREARLLRQLLPGLDGRERMLAARRDSLQAHLEANQSLYDLRRQALSKRLRALAMGGSQREIEVILTSQSFAALVTRLRFGTMIARLDANLMRETRSQGQQLALAQTELQVALTGIWEAREEASRERQRLELIEATQRGLVRDLQPAEIVDQVLLACRELGRRVDNVVVMGMGEPLLNFDAVVTALDRLQDAAGLGLGARHVTLSTSGIVPGMERLARLGRQWHLALSLHAVNEAQRARLIPPRHRYALAEVLEACRLYRACTGRIVTLEYALMPGTNDSDADVRGLAAIARDLDARINLIPCNPVSATQVTPAAAAVRRFESAVRALGAKITVRQRKGDRIQAACGQLRRRPQDA